MKNSSCWKLLVVALLVPTVVTHVRAYGDDRKATRPNIVFIEVDDLNYKYFDYYYGVGGVKTPNMDSLAKSGVFFSNAMCQGMMCGPSRNGLITGLYPHNMGFYRNGQMGDLPQGVWAFPAALQRAGYYTAWIGKSHIHPPGSKADPNAMKNALGFDQVQRTLGRAMLGSGKSRPGDWYFEHLKKAGLLEKFREEFPNPTTLAEDDYLDGFFTRTAVDFLADYSDKKPFFLWLNYSLPHGPHDVPQEYHDMYSPGKMPGTTKVDFQAPEKLLKDTKPVRSEQRAREDQARYCAAVTFLDKQVGRVLKQIDERGLRKNTAIFFFSDHGIMMGDHGLRHKGTLFRQVTNPVLIVATPTTVLRDVCVEDPVELRDILDTCLDLAQTPKNDRGKYSGYSLQPLLTLQGKYQREFAFGEIESYVAVTDGQHRLIKGKDTLLLFDESQDPDNLHDIAQSNPKVVARLSAAIDVWLKRTGPVLPPQRRKKKK